MRLEDFLNINDIDFLENEPMKDHTTFRVGGPADFLILPKDKVELIYIMKFLNKADIDYLVMGNGSNLLVRDGGIRGVVIKLGENFSDIRVKDNIIIAQSGALLSQVSNKALENSLEGFEFASGIPGTIGGGTTMNAGAYGGEIRDVVKSVKVIDEKGMYRELTKDELNLGYRTSIIQEKNMIIVEVVLDLKKGNYEEIKEHIRQLTEKRTSKQPLEWPSGGSTFKRPEGFFAGKLIDDAGLRGLRHRGAQVSEKHCGFIINRDQASYRDIMELVSTVRKIVKDKYGVLLEMEIKRVGEE